MKRISVLLSGNIHAAGVRCFLREHRGTWKSAGCVCVRTSRRRQRMGNAEQELRVDPI